MGASGAAAALAGGGSHSDEAHTVMHFIAPGGIRVSCRLMSATSSTAMHTHHNARFDYSA
jgi:hypothetical protein